MAKNKRFAGKCPRAKVDALFTQWENNASALAAAYPDDERLDEIMMTMVKTFDAVQEQMTMAGQTTVIVMWQPRIPNFEIDDREYGEDLPF